MTLDPANPMRPAAMSVLVFEIIVVGLALIGMIQVSGVAVWVAVAWCAVATLLCLTAAAGLRHRWGYLVGWAAQVVLIGLGLLTPWMYAMGLLFALIWVTCVVLGRRLEAAQAEGNRS